MIGSLAAFWAFAAILVVSALAVVTSRNLFHSVLWLALALTGTAGIFLTLHAEFLAAVQILLYAGGVITIVVFAIVVTERLVGERLTHTNRRIGGGVLIAAALLVAILRAIDMARLPRAGPEMPTDITERIGTAVLTRHALPFELLAMLLVTALIGAIYFARPED